ncbi:hypothetical protein [Actinoplanes sp. NPDC048796]|uniref:hypothetical protein n=1 Tax=Actinoplanes sp. NPDC048796 TaxID=3155640 RepID=UPI00340CDF94
MRYLAVGLAVVLGLSACAAPKDEVPRPEVAPSVSLPADPKAALAVGSGKAGTQSVRVGYRFTGSPTYEVKYTAVVDAAGTTWEATGDSWVLRRVRDDVWVKVTKPDELGAVPESQINTWVKAPLNYLDQTSFKGGFPWNAPRTAAETGTGITAAGDRTYTGRLRDESFTLSLDEAGRFTRATAGDFLEMTFSDFGTPVAVEPPPAGEVSPGPPVFLPAHVGIM